MHDGYATALEAGHYHPLLLTGAYVLDLLVIHPFSDGNGRMARLLTLLLLYEGGATESSSLRARAACALSKTTKQFLTGDRAGGSRYAFSWWS